MRIHAVSMTGFGPFRHTQTVDFDAFADHGTFLITGRTGAGKSSILDAIVYALYDSAPRYSAAGGKQVRSDHCTPQEPSRVELVFSTASGRYRVVRTPEYRRPKSRGEGFTTEKATAELSRWQDDQWVGVASQLRTVGEALHEIVPLSADQFLQVVLLAQGQFQRFLVASSEERQRLLRTLFRSDRFGRYDEVLQQRAGELRKRIELADEGVGATLRALATHAGAELPETPGDEWVDEVLRAHDTDLVVARDEAEQAQKELAEAESLLSGATLLASRQQRRARAERDRVVLAERQEQVDLDRVRRDRGLAAASCGPAHRTLSTARREQQSAAQAVDAATRQYLDVVGDQPPADLEARRDELGSRLATVRAHVADERRLEQLRDDLAGIRTGLAEVREQVTVLTGERDRLAAGLAEDLDISAEKAQLALTGLRDELGRATRREQAVAELQRAEVVQLEFGRARTTASTALDLLRERRLAEYAGTLAHELRAGEPCAVCGATEHPQPAPAPAEPVTEAMQEAAEHVLADADERAREADQTVLRLRATVESLAGVRPAAELTVLVDEAADSLRVAQRAEAERVRATAALATTETELKQAELRCATLEANLADTTNRIDVLARKVEAARGDTESIADLLTALTQEKKVADTLAEASARARETESLLAGARTHLADLLDHHGFADEADLVAARVDAPTLEQLGRVVRRHDDALAAATAVLDEPELQDLPSEPADVATPQQARDDARLACDDAVGRHGSVRTRAGHSHELATAIRAGWDRTAEIRAEYEVLNRLARSVHGDSPNTRRMRLESYVLGAELTQIVTAANTRLRTMSAGRYELQRSTRQATKGNNAGLEVQVLDHHTGETRSPESLSGGERFLASLSLALGLAEVVTNRAGGITLDTLFVDEGFGSLDAETLDLAMHTLDGLRVHGRTVGLISHVDSMRERIGAQLAVEPTAGGWSEIVVRA